MIIACAALCLLAQAPTLSDEEKAQGFVSAFNGVDLTGWKEVQGNPGTFSVADNAIIGQRKVRGPAYWLSTADKYDNFEIRLQYLLSPKGNSGVFIRVPSYEGRTSRVGMEVQLRDDFGKKTKPTADESGAIYQVVPATAFASRPAGEWNDLFIRCDGESIKITLNGQLVNDVRMNEHAKLNTRSRAGYIGLSAHTDVVKFRHIRIKRLTPVAASGN